MAANLFYCCCPPSKLSFSFSSFQIYLITTLLVFSLPKFSETYRDLYWTYILPFILPVAHVGLMGSTYSTLALAVERYVAVCHPFQARRFVTIYWDTAVHFSCSGSSAQAPMRVCTTAKVLKLQIKQTNSMSLGAGRKAGQL